MYRPSCYEMVKRREMGIGPAKKALIGSHCDGSQLSSRPRTPIPWRDFTVTDDNKHIINGR